MAAHLAKGSAMKRVIVLTLAIAMMGGRAMALNEGYQPERAPLNGQRSPEEILNQSERGRELNRLVQDLMAGDKEAFEKGYEAYREKYSPPPMGSPYPGTNQPARRQSVPDLGPPMMLPPEAQ